MILKYTKSFIAIVSTAFFLISCGGDDSGQSGLVGGTVPNDVNPTNPTTSISPGDANALAGALIMPTGTQVFNGLPPATTFVTGTPSVFTTNSSITSSNGSTAPLSFDFSSPEGDIAGVYVQVEGADSYFDVPAGSGSTSGSIEVPIGIPTNVSAGLFSTNYCVYDNQGRVSNVINTQFEVLALGTGSLQISLSWNTPTDQDLYVTDPNGDVIYYGNTFSASGGSLDRDDLDGYGPENIYWDNNAPDGQYVVSVNDYEFSSSPNTCYVTVSGPSGSNSFTVTTQSGNTVEVTTFTKSGDVINF